MSNRQTGLAVLGACLLACSIGLSAEPIGNPAQGQAAAAICAACHQADGSGMNIPGAESWPRLAGLDASYLAKQLQDFKSGQRSSPTMQAFAQMLSDEQIPHVAAWFASLPAPSLPSAEAHAPALLERGRQLATEGDWDNYLVPCSSCHGPDNLGAGAVFPAIAGQHPAYIRDQLLNWQKGSRQNDPQQLMATVAARMSADDIQAVAAWLSTQPGATEQKPE